MAVIDESVVRIGPDFTGFKTKLKAGLKANTAGITATVRVTVSTVGLRADITAKLARIATPTMKVRLVADASGLNAVRQATARLHADDVRATADAERQKVSITRGALGQIDREHARSVRERKAALDRLNKDLRPKIIDWGGAGIRPVNALIGAAVALSPALLAVASSAVQASTSIVALGSAAYGTTLAVVGIVQAFSSVTEAWKLYQNAQKSDLGKTASAARDAIADQRAVAAARRNVAGAIRDEKSALAEVATAYEEARRKVRDLREELSDLALQESGDALDLEEAKRAQREVANNYFATALERAQAAQKVKEAEDRLSDTQRERGDVEKELTKREKAGLAGSEEVKAARERAADATERRIDAEQSLAAALDRSTAAVTGTSAAQAQLEERLKGMSPVARAMFGWLKDHEEMFKGYRRAMERAILPGFLDFLRDISERPKGGQSVLDIFVDGITGIGRQIGGTVRAFGKLMKTPYMKGALLKLNKNQEESFDYLGRAGLKMIKPITQLIVAASPLTLRFAKWLDRIATRFAAWIDAKDKSGELAKWFKDAGDELAKWGRIAGNLGSFLLTVFGQSLPTGKDLVSRLEALTKSLADWAKRPEGQQAIREFFEIFKNIDYQKLSQVVGQVLALTAVFKIGKTIAKHPLFTVLTILAAGMPEQTAWVLKTATTSLLGILGWMERNPLVSGSLLAILLAWKGIKNTSLVMKIPGLSKLNEIFGGKATTATMTVRASVVHVYGNVAPGKGGKGAKPGVGVPMVVSEFDATNAKGKPKNIFRNLGGNLAKGGIILAATAFITDLIVDSALMDEEQGTIGERLRRFFSMDVPNLLVGGERGWSSFENALENDFGKGFVRWWSHTLPDALNLGEGSGWSALGSNLKRWFSTTLPNFMSGREGGWSGLGAVVLDEFKEFVGWPAVKGLWEGISGGGTWLWEKLTGWYDDVVGFVKRLFGIESPSTVFASIGGELIAGLWQGIQTKWTGLTATVSTWVSEKVTAPLSALFGRAGTAMKNALLGALDLLPEGMSKPVKKLFDWIDTNLIGKLNTLLRGLGVTEISPINFGATADAGRNVGTAVRDVARIIGGNQQRKIRRASGGAVPGFSPHPRADNIPAMLTADEYVQPVDAVRHYGLPFMEAIRRKRLPRFADGGVVAGMPDFGLAGRIARGALKSLSGLNLRELAARLIGAFGGGFDQEYTGRAPRGLGRITGLGQRIMAAAIDAHQRFPWASVWSGFRPDAITVTGNRSYHGLRRATDWPPSMELFNYFVEKYGDVAKEIIYSPAGRRQIWNGKPHMYSGAVRNTHFDHVHLALAQGGQVPKPSAFRKYGANAHLMDNGGTVPPGTSVIVNKTGAPETVRNAFQERQLRNGQEPMRLDRRDIALLAAHIANAASPTVQMDGQRVAEITNRYSYLPAGV